MVLLLQVPSPLLLPSLFLSFLFLIFSATTRVSGLRAVKPAHKSYSKLRRTAITPFGFELRKTTIMPTIPTTPSSGKRPRTPDAEEQPVKKPVQWTEERPVFAGELTISLPSDWSSQQQVTRCYLPVDRQYDQNGLSMLLFLTSLPHSTPPPPQSSGVFFGSTIPHVDHRNAILVLFQILE